MVSSTSRPKRPPAGPPDEGPATRDAASTTVVTAPTPMVSAPELKKKDLIDRVVAASGVKKRDAKPAVEATLAVLGEALSEGRDLNLPPLGKTKINNVKDKANARVLNLRLRRPTRMIHETDGKETAPESDKSTTSPLADRGEDG
ncbi:DNA-binding protein HU-alpha [Tranquillimonas rosea]|uniref:DNA-binding protein HU-alpha n=1 Tax=Tranquillimonas rosea TaxID=641238 RepID=A0A1H9TL90_9RHOB|nr:DNA-binding protein HU-alpha [Tranquillimonas rosea]